VLFFMLQLGEILHKTLSEIRAMPSSELMMWRAYFNIKNEEAIEGKKHKTRTKKQTLPGNTDVEKFKNMLGIN